MVSAQASTGGVAVAARPSPETKTVEVHLLTQPHEVWRPTKQTASLPLVAQTLCPDSCHWGVSVQGDVEGVEDGLGGLGDGVAGDVVVAGDVDGDLLNRLQGVEDLAHRQPGGRV